MMLARVACFPINSESSETNGKRIILRKSEQKHLLNHTVPEAFLSIVSPPEYLKTKGINGSTDDPSSFLAFQQSSNANQTDSSGSSVTSNCPIKWVLDRQDNRLPRTLQKAVCNLQGTTCLNPQGRPSCKEILQKFAVLIIHYDVIKIQYQSIAMGCVCSGD